MFNQCQTNIQIHKVLISFQMLQSIIGINPNDYVQHINSKLYLKDDFNHFKSIPLDYCTNITNKYDLDHFKSIHLDYITNITNKYDLNHFKSVWLTMITLLVRGLPEEGGEPVESLIVPVEPGALNNQSGIYTCRPC